jgi:4-amino-4-deoxy-L-arabinose transferase-like glycosyltransferase
MMLLRSFIHLIRARPLLFILLLAAVLRLGIVLRFPSVFAWDQTGTIHGSTAYDTYATNLLATGVYGKAEPGLADAHLPPLYSYLLAGVYALFGRSAPPVIALHILFDLISITCLYHIAACLFPSGKAVGVLAGLAYALYPYLIFQNMTLIDTPMFMALLHGFILLIVLLVTRATGLDRTGWYCATGAGVLLGLMALTRTNSVLFAFGAALWAWLMLDWRRAAARMLPVALASVIIVAPWIARSSALYSTFVPIALNGGENFYQGNSIHTIPYFRAGYDVQWVPPPEGMAIYPDRFGPEANNARQRAGMDYLVANPSVIPELLWVKFLVHWSVDIAPLRNPVEGEQLLVNYDGTVAASTDASGDLALTDLPSGDPVGAYSSSLFDQVGRLVHRLYFGGLLALAFIGFVLSWRFPRPAALIWLIQIINTLTYVIFHPSTRYRVPTDPLLFSLSAYAFIVIALWIGSKTRSRKLPYPAPQGASS